MDFLKRDEQAEHVATHPAAGVVPGPHTSRKKKLRESKMLRWAFVILLFSTTILVVALLVSLAKVDSKDEIKYVDNKKLQVVTLTNGLVYVGKITNLNSDYVRLRDIFYITPNQNVQNADEKPKKVINYNLVKPGCEIFGLQDEMVINRKQLVFWENLRPDGKASKGVEAWRKQNPNGLNCTATNTSTNNNTTQ